MENDKPEIVRIKLDDSVRRPQASMQSTTKAFQVKINENKTLVVYNHVQAYILDALMKAVFSDAH